MALAIDPRFSRCKPGGFGAFRVVERTARVGRAKRRRLLAEKGDAELADPPARPFWLHHERDGVQFIPVFLMPAAVTVEDAVAGFRIDGSPEWGRIVHADHRAATIRDRTWLAHLQHGASIAQEERAAFLHAGGAEGGGLTSVFDGDGEAEAERVQEGVEASEFRVASVGEHAIQVFAIELGSLCHLRDPSLRLSDVS